jgi:hypothetical protein
MSEEINYSKEEDDRQASSFQLHKRAGAYFTHLQLECIFLMPDV